MGWGRDGRGRGLCWEREEAFPSVHHQNSSSPLPPPPLFYPPLRLHYSSLPSPSSLFLTAVPPLPTTPASPHLPLSTNHLSPPPHQSPLPFFPCQFRLLLPPAFSHPTSPPLPLPTIPCQSLLPPSTPSSHPLLSSLPPTVPMTVHPTDGSRNIQDQQTRLPRDQK